MSRKPDRLSHNDIPVPPVEHLQNILSAGNDIFWRNLDLGKFEATKIVENMLTATIENGEWASFLVDHYYYLLGNEKDNLNAHLSIITKLMHAATVEELPSL